MTFTVRSALSPAVGIALGLCSVAGPARAQYSFPSPYDDPTNNPSSTQSGRDSSSSTSSRPSPTGTAGRQGAEAARSQNDASSPDRSSYRDDLDTLRTRDISTSRDPSRDSTEDVDVEGQRLRQRADRLTPPRLPNEFEGYVSDIVGKPLRRFGTTLLIPGSRDFTAPPTVSIPDDYRINPGDVIELGLAGSVDATNLRLPVDSQGRIFVPRVGPVTVAGLRFGNLQGVVAGQVSRVYRNFRISTGVARLHGITVYVTGFAAVPGSYTVSSLSTVVNAVLAAGGPSPGGSFRSIQVRRGGKLVADFDLYDLLLKGDKTGDVVLQNSDVIYIAPVGAQAAVIGSVNNEAIFEAAPGETVRDLLLDAGGVNTVADDSRALVFEPLNPLSRSYQQLSPGEAGRRPVARAMIVRILSGVGIAQPTLTQSVLVTVSGEVARPGRYFLQPGTTLAAVLARAGGLTRQAYPYATVFTRESVKRLQQQSYERAVRELQLSLTLKPLISATSSAVPVAVDQGLLVVSQSIVEQLRARRPEGRVVLELPPEAAVLPGDVVLENNDSFYIPPRPTSVGVFGAVNSPTSFLYRGNLRISDYIERAGGVQRFADRRALFVVRANGTVLNPKAARRALALPGDVVFVPYNANRGEFWARLRDLTGVLFGGLVSTAAVASVVK